MLLWSCKSARKSEAFSHLITLIPRLSCRSWYGNFEHLPQRTKWACGKLWSAPTQIITPRGLRGMAQRSDSGHFAVLLCSICINIPGLLSIKVPSALQFWVQIIYCNTKKKSQRAMLSWLWLQFFMDKIITIQCNSRIQPALRFHTIIQRTKKENA